MPAISKARAKGSAKRTPYDFRALLTYRLLVLSNTLGKGAVRLYTGRYGIQLAEWRLLAALALVAPINVNALSKALSADKSWVSRVAAALVDKGLATTRDDPSDARRMDIELTAAGRAMYARILPAAVERQRRLVEALSPAEQRTLDRILDKLQRQADFLLEAQPAADHTATPPQKRSTGRKSVAQ